MNQNSNVIIINCADNAVKEIQGHINSQPEAQSQATERKNLDGDVATWIVVATLATQSVPHLLDFMKPFLPNKQVTKIKYGEWEIENPSKEDLERFRALLDEEARKRKDNG